MVSLASSALDRAATDDDLLTPGETSLLVRLSESTLKDRRWKGTGPAYIKLSPGRGGRIRYKRSDVVAWLQSMAVEAGRVGVENSEAA